MVQIRGVRKGEKKKKDKQRKDPKKKVLAQQRAGKGWEQNRGGMRGEREGRSCVRGERSVGKNRCFISLFPPKFCGFYYFLILLFKGKNN